MYILRESTTNAAPHDLVAVEDSRHVRRSQVTTIDREGQNGCILCEDGVEYAEVELGGRGDQQAIDRLRHAEGAVVGHASGGVELASTEPLSFLALVFGRREHNDIASHLGGELDCEMSEPTDTHDADSLVGLAIFN